MSMDPALYKTSCEAAQKMIETGNGDEILSSKETKNFFGQAPVTARRWISLASPNHDGDDDYFSSDLSDEQLLKSFGTLPKETPLCVLISGNDEYMPKTLDKEALLRRWVDITKKGEGRIDEIQSGILEGASHNLAGDKEEIVEGLVKRVLGFLKGLGEQSNL